MLGYNPSNVISFQRIAKNPKLLLKPLKKQPTKRDERKPKSGEEKKTFFLCGFENLTIL
jgi:hypothetical protein